MIKPKKQRILVACEYSGTVREAFKAKGHNVRSCDLLPTDIPGNHIQGDVREHLKTHSYDMIIWFIPCTHIAVSGARWFKEKRLDGRQQKAIDFFMYAANYPCERMVIENPVGIMSTIWRKPNQIIQPWQFGHKRIKKTCLWLKNLPVLKSTKIVEPEYQIYKSKKNKSGYSKYDKLWGKLGPNQNRRKIRSKTFQGIATAMAEQGV